MDKNAIKKYAVWARRELIERISQRAMIYGITEKDIGDPKEDSVNGHLLSQAEKRQRQALIRNIKTKGYEQVMEEVAYTWFNRFAALRFMEVNGYLPSHIRVFTNDAGEFKPQILAEAIHLELDGLDMNKVYELESANKSEELFKYLLIVQCNALNNILPGMFQRIEDYTELLLPDYLLREGSVIEQMVTTIPEEDWTDQVQIIGWLYQYYNTEPKDKVFADQKKGIKVSKENVPAATQLFTPDWIVHYMVENSLGRLWLESHPNDALKSEWKYYLDEAEQEPEVQAQLSATQKENASLKPEEIRVIDPCMGSGHILCVYFDVLVRIYEDYGYTAREAAVKIVENNLWGLDIDDRAAQLSYFAVMMKARQYDRRFFTRKVQPHVYAIHETNALKDYFNYAQNDFRLSTDHKKTLDYLINAFVDAKEYGSILKLENYDYHGLKEALKKIDDQNEETITLWYAALVPEFPHLIEQAVALTQSYHVVVTNPPYMNSGAMNDKLNTFAASLYPFEKYDLFAILISKCASITRPNGFCALITMESWMFRPSYEKFRRVFLSDRTLISMLHMPYLGKGRNSMEISFGTAAFVFKKSICQQYRAQFDYIRYFELDDDLIPKTFPVVNERYVTMKPHSILKIPGIPFGYWASDALCDHFTGRSLKDIGSSKSGMQTGNNDRFLRAWPEVDIQKIGFGIKSIDECLVKNYKWIPHTKGGDYRKWYGNHELVVNFENDGYEIRNYKGTVRVRDTRQYFTKGITWSHTSSKGFGARVLPEGFIFNVESPSYFTDPQHIYYVLGLLNSEVAEAVFRVLNQTMSYQSVDIERMPLVIDESRKKNVEEKVQRLIAWSKEDWDSKEISWDYRGNPLVKAGFDSVEEACNWWYEECEKRYQRVKGTEEELNKEFIEIYGLEDELSYSVSDSNIAIAKGDIGRIVRELISFAVGCMMGRYSLDCDGISSINKPDSIMFHADTDGIIPISDDEYFEDDIVGRFVQFISIAFGKAKLEENLSYISKALGGKGASRTILRNYFINDFYTDHCATYSFTGTGKRPIYWLFDSGKKNGFKCLIYMHRYQPDTIARIRTDYVHEQQSRYRTAIADLEQRINGASTSERVKLSKQLATLQAQAEEIRVYEEKIHHLADQMIKIDLDDGVKHNYEIFKDVLAKIK